MATEFKLKHPIKEIEGWDDYFISTNGIVYSCKRETLAFINGGLYQVRPKPHNRGYLEVGLYRFNPQKGKKERKWIRIHQLVANAFIPKPADSDTVKYEPNHRNGIKTDNRLENLEWMTHSENQKHSIETLGQKIHMRAITYDGVTYESIKECAETNGLNVSSLRAVLSYGSKTYMGKKLEYAEAPKIKRTYKN
jgi:hypothetical protein